jgi:4'-phosphopantetheinyl transferase
VDEADAVHVWVIRLDLSASAVAGLATVLDDAERTRAGALTQPGHRHRYTATHGAARVIIGDFAGVPAGQVEWSHGPNGKPELAGACRGLQVSLSHSGRLAVLAIAVGRRVGVDVQQFPARTDVRRMAERFYRPDEARFVAAGGTTGQLARFIRLWARKEACVKVTGGVLMQGMRLPVRGNDPIAVHDPDGPLPGPYLVRDLAVPRRFRGAVAVEGLLPCDVIQHRWPGDSGHQHIADRTSITPLYMSTVTVRDAAAEPESPSESHAWPTYGAHAHGRSVPGRNLIGSLTGSA